MAWMPAHHPSFSYAFKPLLVSSFLLNHLGLFITMCVNFIFIKKSSWVDFVPGRSFGDRIYWDKHVLFKYDGNKREIFKLNGNNFLQQNFKPCGKRGGEGLFFSTFALGPQIIPRRQNANQSMLILLIYRLLSAYLFSSTRKAELERDKHAEGGIFHLLV